MFRFEPIESQGRHKGDQSEHGSKMKGNCMDKLDATEKTIIIGTVWVSAFLSALALIRWQERFYVSHLSAEMNIEKLLSRKKRTPQ